MESVCYQVGGGQAGNYMQFVCENMVINCDKSVAVYIKQIFTQTTYIQSQARSSQIWNRNCDVAAAI